MPEQLSIPEGQEATISQGDPNPQGFPTFGDLPEANPRGPRITFAEEAPDEAAPESSPAPEPPPVSPPATVEFSPPPAAVSPPGGNVAQELFQAMAALDDYKDQKRAYQENQRQSDEWKPPEIPDELAEEVLTDPKKMKAFIQERDNWHRQAAVNTVQPLAQELNANRQMLTTMLYREHQRAWDSVRDDMQAQGVNADGYYGQVEGALRKNPQTYWNLATDARALKTAVEVLHRAAGGPQTFANKPEQPKAPPTAGKSAAAPNKAKDSIDNYTHPAIEQAERVFGRKLSKASKEAFRRGDGGAIGGSF